MNIKFLTFFISEVHKLIFLAHIYLYTYIWLMYRFRKLMLYFTVAIRIAITTLETELLFYAYK